VFKKNSFLLISVFLHLIVMYVVAQSVMFTSVPISPTKKIDMIQAVLIFDFPAPTPEIPIEIIKKEKPQPAEQKEKRLVAKTPADSQIKPIEDKKLPLTPVTTPTLPLPLAIQPEPELESEIPQEPEQNGDVNDIMITNKNNAPIPSSDISAPVISMAKRHLRRFQQQQQTRVAEQASRYYQQRKNSPVIDDEVKNPFMTEDEKIKDTLKVRADCSSTSKKTAAVLLSYLGGQIDCSKPPAINSFIQNRINKASLLSKHYQQQEQKIPQSIVIKKQP
jgi:hypothetical protein